MSEPFIVCKQIVKAYTVSDHEIVALRGIDFKMERGEMVAIIGPSGAGKSSLMNLLGGLDTPTAGQLSVDGLNLLDMKPKVLADYRLKHVGFVWQQVDRNLFPHRTALQNVILPMTLARQPLKHRRNRAMELLEAVGIADRAKHYPTELSGGQQQRVAIAVALANQPQLLLADEPTGALDSETANQVMDLLMHLREQFNLTVLMVTHDLKMAKYSDRVLTLRDGALGQDLSDDEQAAPQVEEDGKLQLPKEVQSHLAHADRIAIEIRPEGVLIRPEIIEVEDTEALLSGIIPEDAPPPEAEKRSRLARLFRRKPKTESKAG